MIPDDDETTKKLVIIFGGIIAVLLIVWVLIGAPVVGIKIHPLQPSDNIPSWEEAKEEQVEISRAYEKGYYNEDEGRREIRQKALSALENFKNAPCDSALKQDFIEAATDFLDEMRKNFKAENPPTSSTPEIFTFNNKIISGRTHFDSPVYDRVTEALSDPRIKQNDLPKRIRNFKSQINESMEDQDCQ